MAAKLEFVPGVSSANAAKHHLPLHLSEVNLCGLLHDLFDSSRINLGLAVIRIEPVHLLFNIRPADTKRQPHPPAIIEDDLQLSINQPTAMAALHNANHELLDSSKKILRITSGSVSPVFLSSGWCVLG